MEWCAKLYVNGNMEKYVRCLTEILAVCLIICLFAGTIDVTESSVSPVSLTEETDNSYGRDALKDMRVQTHMPGYESEVLTTYASAAADMHMVLSVAVLSAARTGSVISELLPEVSVKEVDEAAVSDKKPGLENVAAGSTAAGIPGAEISGDNSGTLSGSTVEGKESIALETPEKIPAIPENVPAEPAEVPVEPVTPSLSEPQMAVVKGFLVDETGMICGITDLETAVEDGRLVLPSEGCTAVGKGAFASAPAGIREVYIPANITYIEEGAFTGLNEAEWFEVESDENYVCTDGVLFSDGGTCLLAFPAGRIGIYKVPSEVLRFAFDAFADASIYKLDARSCRLEDVGNISENIEILSRI